MGLIAGTVHKHGDSEFFEHFFDFGSMIDHRILNGQVTAALYQQLIIRFTVLSGKLKFPRLHRFLWGIKIPVVLCQGTQPHCINRIHRIKKRHGCGI